MIITKYAVTRRLATAAMVFCLLVLGVYGALGLPVNFLPEVTYPLIKVHIWWRGATPEEVERSIAVPIERVMATVDGMDYLDSSSIEGMYTLQANFKYGVSIETAYQDALAALARVARELPRDMDPPVVIKADPSQLPVVQLTIASESRTMVGIRDWAENWLQEQLVAVPGVAGTEIVGGLKREIRVHLDPEALQKHGLSLPLVLKRLAQENVLQFGGRVNDGRQEFIARTVGEYRSLDDIRSVLMVRDGHAKVLLGDLATVEDAHEEVRVVTRLDGKPCVKLSVMKQADANTVAVSRAVSKRLAELGAAMPEDIQIALVENQADYVLAALNGVRNAAVEAAILVVLLMALFLGSWRQVAAMAWALPATLLLNFGLMKLAGFSLNLFSLGGLVVAIAIDLDNSIIVIENITRLHRERPQLRTVDLVVTATSQVGPAVIAATASFLALFLPFLLVPGLTSLLFRELILVIAGVMIISLVMAISVTPLFMALLLGRHHPGVEHLTWFERQVERVTAVYSRALQAVLRRKAVTVALFCVLLGLGGWALPHLDNEFLPQMDDGRVMVKVKLPAGTSLDRTHDILKKLEATLPDDPLVESAFTLAGGKVWGLYTYEIANEGEINIQLVPKHRRQVSTAQYIAQLRARLSAVPMPVGKVMVAQVKIKGIRQVGESDLELLIKGQNLQQLYAYAGQVAGIMQEQQNITNVRVSMDMTKPEYQIQVDRVRAGELGLSIEDIASTLRTLVRGEPVTRFREGDQFYNIRVMVPEHRIASRRNIENLPLSTIPGGHLRLGDVAAVREAVGPVEIIRRDQVKTVVVQADVAGASVGAALEELKSALATVEKPAGFELSYGGQAQMMAEMRINILLVLAFALFFSLVVLMMQFNSLRLPVIILSVAPFCLTGLVLMLYAASIPFGATVIIGVLVVMAANVNEGVLLLTLAEEIRHTEGLSPTQAVAQAARIRFRPRVMTTLGVLVGFLPLALNIEEGGDMLQPMAVAAIGGLLVTVLVALFLVPCIYVLFTQALRPTRSVPRTLT